MASVSYKGVLDSAALGSAMISATFPPGLTAYMAAFLDEVPVSLLARVVEQVHVESGMARQALWANMRHMALDLKSTRKLWCKVTRTPQEAKNGDRPAGQ